MYTYISLHIRTKKKTTTTTIQQILKNNLTYYQVLYIRVEKEITASLTKKKK